MIKGIYEKPTANIVCVCVCVYVCVCTRVRLVTLLCLTLCDPRVL